MFKRLLIYTSLIWCCGCSVSEQPKQELDFLIGAWHTRDSGFNYSEKWRSVNDSALEANCYFWENGIVKDSEKVSIERLNGKLVYSALVYNQNGGQKVAFTLIDSAKKRYIFENPTHDFPQRIIYDFRSPDSLFASIEGTDSTGKIKSVEFNMVRDIRE